jgi:hypothetical protein
MRNVSNCSSNIIGAILLSSAVTAVQGFGLGISAAAFDEGEVLARGQWCAEKMYNFFGPQRCHLAKQLSREVSLSYIDVQMEGSGNRIRVTLDFWNSSQLQCVMEVRSTNLSGEGWWNSNARTGCSGTVDVGGRAMTFRDHMTNQVHVLRLAD